MKSIKIKYNKKEDILYIYFSKNRPAWTQELRDDILLRGDLVSGEIISLEFLFFSKNEIEFEIEESEKKLNDVKCWVDFLMRRKRKNVKTSNLQKMSKITKI